MRWGDILRLSLLNSVRRVKKTILSAGAVAVGVASLVLISAVGEGTYLLADEELSRLGIDGLSLFLEDTEDRTLDPLGAELLMEKVPGIRAAMPFKLKLGAAQLLTTTESAVIWGVGEDMAEALHMRLSYGRQIDAREIASSARTAVVDEDFALRVYKRRNIVGKRIRLRIEESWDDYRIVGVTESRTKTISAIAGENISCFVYIPYTVINENAGEYGAEQIAIQCFADADVREVMQRAQACMSQYLPLTEGHYRVENITGYLDSAKEIVRLIGIFAAAIGSIALVVAGIGVMNAMLSGIEERKRELGIYLALGSRYGDIVWNLLIESVFICMLGCLMGCFVGYAAHLAIAKYIPCIIRAEDLLKAVFVSLACGIFFGTVPAVKAAKLDPVEILNRG